MQKNELLRKDDKIVRVLETDGENVFYIFCQGIKSPMPEWGKVSDLNGYAPCAENELWGLYGIEPVPEDELEPGDRTAARKRYSIIVPVLGCLEDVKARIHMIGDTAKEHGITKQTVRNYLKVYLTYNSISALVPKHRTAKEKPMTDDEKNIRYAVNKYVYSRKKNSLYTAYKLMLKDKYTDSSGVLAESVVRQIKRRCIRQIKSRLIHGNCQ